MIELDLLKKPEYIHVVLNHLVIYGTILGAVALAISLILRSRAAQITALVITFIAAGSAYPVLVSGQRAYKPVRDMADDAAQEALDEHMDRAEKTINVFYLLALISLAALLVPIKSPKLGPPLAAVTLALALLCFGLSLYIAQQGGRIRHPEFRPVEPGESPTARYPSPARFGTSVQENQSNQAMPSMQNMPEMQLTH
jgi:hypothetical protein